MKNTFTKKEVQWLLKRQIEKCINSIARMPMASNDLMVVDNDMAIMKKLRTMKPISTLEIKNIKK